MSLRLTRRDFLVTSAAAAAGAAAGLAVAARSEAATWKTTLHKAMIGVPSEQLLKSWKAAGFEGMESSAWQVSPAEAEAARKTAESLGMRIHSVMFGWGNLNGGEAAMADSVKKMETALLAAQAYGAETVLFVPCKIGGMAIPDPWDFDIRFDEKTGYLQQVVAGDNAKYKEYIEAHNRAADASREGIKRLIPTAEKAGVRVAIENVWNNLWVKPELHANFVASFQSPWVRAYFDIGNHVRYARPQDWIHTLGNLLAKCHVKDFKLGPDGRGGGFEAFCNIREGSIDWPAVRKALDDIGYNGWTTIEDGTLTPEEHSRRLDLIIAGE